MKEDNISEVFLKIVELALAIGVDKLNQRPGCWIHNVDEHWKIAVNGNTKALEVRPDGCMGGSVPPYSTMIWWNGWLAGIVDPSGGTMVAGDFANEDALLTALDVAIAQAQA